MDGCDVIKRKLHVSVINKYYQILSPSPPEATTTVKKSLE